jgi:hypothetical protein
VEDLGPVFGLHVAFDSRGFTSNGSSGLSPASSNGSLNGSSPSSPAALPPSLAEDHSPLSSTPRSNAHAAASAAAKESRWKVHAELRAFEWVLPPAAEADGCAARLRAFDPRACAAGAAGPVAARASAPAAASSPNLPNLPLPQFDDMALAAAAAASVVKMSSGNLSAVLSVCRIARDKTLQPFWHPIFSFAA